MSAPDRVLRGEVLQEETRWGLVEFVSYCRIEEGRLVELVEMGVLEPIGDTPQTWTFVARDLQRVRTAQRLSQDLGINLPGIAVILDLLEERNRALARLQHD
jgi:chaperone modulatory protein CbpM